MNQKYQALKPLKSNILFVWLDELEDEFQHESGLIFTRQLSRTKERWGQVVAIGPDVTDVNINEYILPIKTSEAWGAGYKSFEDVWMCTEEDILVVSDEYASTQTYNGSEILFDIKNIK